MMSLIRRSLTRRDTRPSRKRELGRYLGSVDWSVLDSAPDCESKSQLFHGLVKIGLDSIMPLKTIRLHVNDALWVSAEFKALIKSRQKVYARGDTKRLDTFVTSLIVSGSCVAESIMQPKSQTLSGSNLDTANMISAALLEPMQDYSPLACLPPFSNNSEVLTISPSEVFKVLLELNPRKACGPNGINNWLLQEYAGFLTSPVCNIQL